MEKCNFLAYNGSKKCSRNSFKSGYCSYHYKYYDMEIKLPEINSKKYKNLLIIKFPNIAKEWDYEKNKININTVLYASSLLVWWKCSNYGHSYQSKVFNRTKKIKPSGCKECHINSTRIHEKEDLEKKRNEKDKKNPTEIGDKAEEYIQELLSNTGEFVNVEKMGNIGGDADICITKKDGTINYIQVKTLTLRKKGKDVYSFRNRAKYSKNMLIIMLNNERTKFALDFFENIPDNGVTLSFLSKKSKYLDIMYTDLDKFTSKMVELIPFSSTENKMNNEVKKEFEMFERFELFCKKNNLIFERNSTNGNTVDCFVNGFSVQMKYRETPIKNQEHKYSVYITKSCGKINGKNIRKNYEIGDFDFLIVELGGDNLNPGKFKGNFCIIPEKILIEKNVLKSNDCNGKKEIRIYHPYYEKEYWNNELWNNISYFKR